MLKLLFLLAAGEIIFLAAAAYFWTLHSRWRDRVALRKGKLSPSPYDFPLQAAIFLALTFGWTRHLLVGVERGFDMFHVFVLTGMLFCLVIVAVRLLARIVPADAEADTEHFDGKTSE